MNGKHNRRQAMVTNLAALALLLGCQMSASFQAGGKDAEEPETTTAAGKDAKKPKSDEKPAGDEPAASKDPAPATTGETPPAASTSPEASAPPAASSPPAASTPPASDAAPAPGVTQKSDTLVLPGNLVFDSGAATLQSGDPNDQIISQLKGYLDAHAELTLLRVEGHTDNQGDAAANLDLSGKRALAVKQALVSRGIAAERILAVGFGQTKPIADNSTEEGRAQNRRTEFKIAGKNGRNYLGRNPLGGGTEFK